MTSKG